MDIGGHWGRFFLLPLDDEGTGLVFKFTSKEFFKILHMISLYHEEERSIRRVILKNKIIAKYKIVMIHWKKILPGMRWQEYLSGLMKIFCITNR